MKRISIILACMNIFGCLHSQGITLLYKNDMGWGNPLSWIQIKTPTGQTPIQRVPSDVDDVVISFSMSGISTLNLGTDNSNPDFNIGGSSANGPSRCKSMHVSSTQISFDNSSLIDQAPIVNVYTSNGGFVIIDSGSNVIHGHFQLHGGNPAITDLQILHSTYGILFSHADWTGIEWDDHAGLKLVGSAIGGYRFVGNSPGNIFIDSCTFEVNYFILGDTSTATLLNSRVTNNGNNNYLKFLVGRNSNFVSGKDTILSFSHLEFTSSGSEFSGNVGSLGQGPGEVDFLQEDPANPLPNIINGDVATGELSTGMGISGDLKISGNLSGFADDGINNPIPVLVKSEDVFKMGGVINYGSNASINSCIQDFCHYKLEFFGNTNSEITWNSGFPVDTLIINKTACAKVTCDSSLYVSGATRIENGQLVLNPNDDYPYKFVCAGNVDIAQGGGLLLRREASGAVANMAVGGTLTDHNSSPDSTCAGLSNPYKGAITFYRSALPLTLLDFYGRYSDKAVTLSWITEREINTKYFNIEKSLDLLSFVPLANVGASGNSQDNQNYRYVDNSFLNDINYYRLKMVDADGGFTYSKTIAVAAPVNNEITIFPNPVNDQLFISLAGVPAATEISIADAKGSVLNTLKLSAGTKEASVNTADLSAGVYSISFQSGKLKITKRFIKL